MTISRPDLDPDDDAPIAADLANRCASIELLVLDVDGVLTDGRIVLDDQGVESKNFHVRDGLGLTLWRRAGKRSAIISGRSSTVVALRAADLKIDALHQGIDDKRTTLRKLMEKLKVGPSQVCFVGDDLIDLPALRAVGLAACPADAVIEVRRAAHLITRAVGGGGAVREVIETIMKVQGLWRAACENHHAPAS